MHPLEVTLTTLSVDAGWSAVEVGVIEGVPVDAVGLGGFESSLDVFSEGDSFEVVGSAAGVVSAEVVDGEPVGDWSVGEFVGDAVGVLLVAVGWFDSPVSGGISIALPFPAVRSLPHLGQKRIGPSVSCSHKP